MKLTKEQVKAKGSDKLKAIETLCRQLQVVITAEQMITKDGFIKNVVYYNDIEKYDVADTNEKTNELPTKEKDSKQDKVPTPFLREKNFKNSL